MCSSGTSKHYERHLQGRPLPSRLAQLVEHRSYEPKVTGSVSRVFTKKIYPQPFQRYLYAYIHANSLSLQNRAPCREIFVNFFFWHGCCGRALNLSCPQTQQRACGQQRITRRQQRSTCRENLFGGKAFEHTFMCAHVYILLTKKNLATEKKHTVATVLALC